VVSLILAGILFGIILGRFFKVYVLLLAYAVAALVILARGYGLDLSILRMLTEAIVLFASLQLGYVAGLVSTDLRSLTRERRRAVRNPPGAERCRSIRTADRLSTRSPPRAHT
jgi:hypothetical protein